MRTRMRNKRKTARAEFSVDEYYHLYSRGVLKKTIFHDHRDYARFLFLLLYFQSPVLFYNLSRPVSSFVRRQTFNIKPTIEARVIQTRLVEMVSFCLMPNHFHLLVRLVRDNGLALYMQRVLTAYAKYYNAKYKYSGHLFQSAYQAVHIEDNEQLLYTSAYIHKNPRDYVKYHWSSYQDYTRTNRWRGLLVPDLILDQFNDSADYTHWVKDTSAKESGGVLSELLDV